MDAVQELKMKTEVLKRVTKEKAFRLVDIEEQREKLTKLIEMGKEESSVRQQVTPEFSGVALYEVRKMMTKVGVVVGLQVKSIRVHSKMLSTYNDLKEALEMCKDVSENEACVAAKDALEEAELIFEFS